MSDRDLIYKALAKQFIDTIVYGKELSKELTGKEPESLGVPIKWTLRDELLVDGVWLRIQEYKLFDTTQYVVLEQRDGKWSHVTSKTDYQDALNYVREGK